MGVIGEKFKNNEVFVPEVLVAARAMNMGAQLLKPLMADAGVEAAGKVCIGTVLVDLAAFTAASAASITPVPFRADISTISQPSWRESSLTFILSPFFFTTSIMLMAITTGIPSSVSCVVR